MSEQDPFEGWRSYRRHPIQISHHDCILIRLFHGSDNMQFVSQLEGHDCVAFHMALIRACQKRVDEWSERCRTADTTSLLRNVSTSEQVPTDRNADWTKASRDE